MILEVHASSEVGCVREHNEDDCLVVPEERLFVVADGMGGHACGEVASRISIESLEAFYRDPTLTHKLEEAYHSLRRDGRVDDLSSFHEFRLRSAIEYGNLQIFQEASQDPQLEDMGTTIVGLAFVGARVYVGHVGDSRAYRYRRGRLFQLTEDHSLANEYIRMRVLRPEDLPQFPYKNVIVRALGLQEDVLVDTYYRTTRPGDRYLLCSDGLTDLVDDNEIYEVLAAWPGARNAAEELVRRALEYGGIDNVTVMLIDVLDVDPEVHRVDRSGPMRGHELVDGAADPMGS
ncbi:MAG: serine/threonine-protein phosphatase [Myxococcales bacterium]|nr:serine/threonine-protein phosphatase [Myxococcales bacterium]MCB9734398.1 serine/threonine-protein phosphatase [Deltaproteobacteria bacterium]